MTLIDAARAEELYARMGPGIEMSGGSAGNTMAGIASLGGKGAYIGKVRDDQLGGGVPPRHPRHRRVVRQPPLSEGAPTARCLILVTPDAQRTMNTFLGACVELGPDDIDAGPDPERPGHVSGRLSVGQAARQGSLPEGGEAGPCRRPQAVADPVGQLLRNRHRAEFADLVENHVDILFGNEHEIMALYETDSFDQAVAAVRGRCETAVLTRSAKGSVIVTDKEIFEVPADQIERSGGHHGCRRPVRLRLPVRLHQWPEPDRQRPHRRHRRGGSHQPCRRPAGGRRWPNWWRRKLG